MGNSDSTLDPSAGAGLTEEQLATSETLGYRVLGVQPNSPASSAGLVSFLDFLIGCEGDLLLSNDDEVGDIDFVQLLKNSVGKKLELLVYNIKSRRTRLVYMTPQSNWGGKGLIGVTIRLDDYATAEEKLIRVLEVEESSPADVAGLHPETDYLLGTATVSFGSPAVLASILREYENSPLELYVYNTESDMVRVVTLLPTIDWGLDETNEDDPESYDDFPGDRGLLGAEVGMGYLHAFPESCRETDGKSVERKFVKAILPPKQGGAQEIADLTAEMEQEAFQQETQQQPMQDVSSYTTMEALRGDDGPSDEIGRDPSISSTKLSSSPTYPTRPPAAPATGEINAMEYGESLPLQTAQPQLIPSLETAPESSPSAISDPTPAVSESLLDVKEQQNVHESTSESTENQQPPKENPESPVETISPPAPQTTSEPSKSLDKVESETPTALETEGSNAAAPVADEQSTSAATPPQEKAVVTVEKAQPATPKLQRDEDETTTDVDEIDDATAGNASFTTVESSEPPTPVAAAAAAAVAAAAAPTALSSQQNHDNKIHPGLEYEDDHEDDYDDEDDDDDEYTDDEEYDDEEDQPSSSFFGLGRFLSFGKSSTRDSNSGNAAAGATTTTNTAKASDFGLPSPPISKK